MQLHPETHCLRILVRPGVLLLRMLRRGSAIPEVRPARGLAVVTGSLWNGEREGERGALLWSSGDFGLAVPS